MAKIIGLPKLSPTMEEGTLVRWVKKEGDAVEVDDLIAEVETDKATMEFRSFDKGVLLKQLAPEGATLQPDQPVAIFGNRDDDIADLLARVEGGGEPSSAPQPASPGASNQASSEKAEAEAAPAAQENQAFSSLGASGRVLASPVVRKIAREREIDLSQVRGTGPNGRVIKRDVDSLDAAVGLPGTPLRGPSAPPPAQRGLGGALPKPAAVPAELRGAPQADAQAAESSRGAGRVEKLSSMRKTIARRLSESKREIPHFYLTIDIDAEPLVQARKELNDALKERGEKVSLNDLIIKASAVALRLFPKANASFQGESILYHDRVDISVAIAIPEGLVTPVVRDADRLGVLQIAQTVRDFAARAKEKRLKVEEMQNGTFSISNLGMFGIEEFSAVINPPEGAILAVGALRDEPVVKGGAIVPGKRMKFTMSCDHRVVDGAVGAEWLKVLRGILESPMAMLL